MRPLSLANSPQHPATETQLVDAVLALANGTDIALNGVLVPPAPEGFSPTENDLWGDASGGWEAVWRQKLDELRSTLRGRLDLALTDPDRAAAEAIRAWQASRVQPVLRLAPGGLRLSAYYPLPGIEALCDLGLTLLLDLDRGFSGRLCKCRLDSCGRFFLVKPDTRHRPRTRYCRVEHMLAYHGGERGAERVRRFRQRKSETGAPGRS